MEENNIFKFSVLVWNVEGLLSATKTIPRDILQDYSVAILTETYLTKEWCRDNAYAMHTLALQGKRGRLSDGITCLVNPELAPARTVYSIPTY